MAAASTELKDTLKKKWHVGWGKSVEGFEGLLGKRVRGLPRDSFNAVTEGRDLANCSSTESSVSIISFFPSYRAGHSVHAQQVAGTSRETHRIGGQSAIRMDCIPVAHHTLS